MYEKGQKKSVYIGRKIVGKRRLKPGHRTSLNKKKDLLYRF